MIGADGWICNTGYRFPSRWWWRDLIRIPVRVAVHKYERLTRGFSRFDMRNADGFLADIIAGSAYWHFVHTQSWPSTMAQADWLDILLEIRDGFTRVDGVYWSPDDMAFDLLRENFAWLWK